MLSDQQCSNLLDGLKRVIFEKQIQPEILYSYFATVNYLTTDDLDVIKKEISTGQINTFCNILKSKPEAIFVEIQKLAKINQWHAVTQYVEFNLKLLNSEELLWQDFENVEIQGSTETVGNVTNQWSADVQRIQANLKDYLMDGVEAIFKYWSKMGVSRMDKWDDFYNADMIITDEFDNQLMHKNFAELFEGQKFKRLIIQAPAGYGKSTFVHEMVRQWVEDYEWAKQFPLVFLVRLGEIRSTESRLSLKDLAVKCLIDGNDKCFTDAMYSKSLFIFDGFDELQRDLISDEVYDLIIGNDSKYNPHVVVTSRPDTFSDLVGFCHICIELKGFSKIGIVNHLKNFGLDFLDLDIASDIVKVPFFAALIGILQTKENSIRIESTCELIDLCIKHLVTRYRQVAKDFSDQDEVKMFNLLGQAAQAQFVFFRSYEKIDNFYDIKAESSVSMPDFQISRKDFISVAKSAYLILPSSSSQQIHFPHKLFAEYFAAYYWSKHEQNISYISEMKHLHLRGFWNKIVYFKNHNYCCESTSWYAYCCESTSWFSCFLCYFNKSYKTKLWKAVESCGYSVSIPLFYNYEELPLIKVKAHNLDFQHLSDRLKQSAVEKLIFLHHDTEFWYLTFNVGQVFYNLTNVTGLHLSWCTINLTGQNFIAIYNVEKLDLDHCKFISCHQANANSPIKTCGLSKLKILKIDSPDGDASTFITMEMMEICKNLKFFEIRHARDSEWINSLENKQILKGEISFGYGKTKTNKMLQTFSDAKRMLQTDFPTSGAIEFCFECTFA